MIYLCAIALLATSAALIWLLGLLMERGRVRDMRTLLLFVGLALLPGCFGLAFVFLRDLVLRSY
ncbi:MULTISPECIES: hypothetical protein [unclassified Sphingomonas]|uniref:hypothetical protein n=1 Tax=unclassified Sphingomonas TaxID=196159 RepID=UPI0006FAB085|nr:MULTISPECIES: hypothetical protein [unclassified Sphingomonas]KQX20062.1 hypothetical protein ASD17_09175 [Sphingomonas sp. Root1294]KQY67312.1 hypothetical protein ASD39_09235 [Sphingomonas sp. Root50]KRB90687.1 hypothetical protein ASE22_10245 [Sphingomonas sp. Root720]